MNTADIILTVLIAAAFIAAVVRCIKNHRSGKCCGECHSCTGCPHRNQPTSKQ